MKKSGILFVVSAPSGAGKTTLAKMVIRSIPEITFSTSHTTRKPRPNEINGKDYQFVSHERFSEMIGQGDFIEWAEVFGNYYGTSYQSIDEVEKGGKDLLLDIDVQGAAQLQKKQRNGCYIFILPPSIEVLMNRLRGRGSDSDKEIKKRIGTAAEEIRCYKNYDYIIINNDLDKAARQLESIILAERCRYPNFIPVIPGLEL